MRIFDNNAQINFYNTIKAISENHQNWRSIYFNFAKLDKEYRDGIRSNVLINIIKDLLKNDEGYVYLFEDGDIILLFKGSVSKIKSKFSETIQDLLPSDKINIKSEDFNKDFCFIYDLSINWNEYQTLVKNKTRDIEQYKIAAKELDNKTVNLKNSVTNISIELVEKALEKRLTREKLQILLVEDDAFTRKLITNVLRPTYDVIEADSAILAIDKYSLNAPDIVFLDIGLPDGNGHVILQEIMSKDKHGFVVMLSGNSQKENVIAALEDGSKGFITKPFAKEKLLHYINLAINHKISYIPSLSKKS